jgi:hypothetical protein
VASGLMAIRYIVTSALKQYNRRNKMGYDFGSLQPFLIAFLVLFVLAILLGVAIGALIFI